MLMPLIADETELLLRCEQTIAAGLADFLRVGEALLTISRGKLYRESHRTFEEYCRQRWELPRRTAYHKIRIAEAYANVHNCAHLPPTNEYQLRLLLALPTPELQREAWQRAQLHGITPSAAVLREAVRRLQREQQGDRMAACLLADRVFPGIPFRWEVCTFVKDDPRQLALADLSHLSTPSDHPATPSAPVFTRPSSCTLPLVLVSPDIDIFPLASPEYLRQFAAVLAGAANYRFLLWSSDAELFRAVPCWPTNVELGLRITTRADLARLPVPPAADSPTIPFLWLLPLEPLTLPDGFPYTRLLLGSAPATIGKSSLDPATCRHLLANALGASCAVHLAAGVQQLFC